MAGPLEEALEKLKQAKGPFFLARLALRVSFDPADPRVADQQKAVEELQRACSEMDVDLSALE